MPRPRSVVRVVAWLLPLLLLGAVELGLRVADYGGDQRLFVHADDLPRDLLRANRRAGLRYFGKLDRVPSFPNEPFLRQKPARGFRVFVLGESAANGFPYGHNGGFSRVLRDALSDLLPGDTVEVVNLGMAALTSYALADQAREVIAQQPDAVVFFGGHNEFYGALGAASTLSLRAPPVLVRGLVSLQGMRLVRLVRNATLALASRSTRGDTASTDPFMRTMVRLDQIPEDRPVFRRALEQLSSNLGVALGRYREAGVPVFVGGPVSNLRDQPPFRPLTLPDGVDASALFDRARAALDVGDSLVAKDLFVRARDLDGLRFRAPTPFADAVREVTREYGALFVPLEEAFDEAARFGIAGNDLFWEHVHPRHDGHLLLARRFLEAMLAADVPRAELRRGVLAPWADYERRMRLTDFDHEYARRQILLLTSRWPFTDVREVTAASIGPRPTTLRDSLAISAVLGTRAWAEAKGLLAIRYAETGELTRATDEVEGIAREYPFDHEALEFLGDLRARSGDTTGAWQALTQAYRVRPSARSAYGLGVIMLERGAASEAIPWLEQAVTLRPALVPGHMALARAFLASGDLDRARTYARQVARAAPGYPGVVELLIRIDSAGR